MSNPAEFVKACVDGKVWLFCSECQESKNFNDVEHIDSEGHPSYWGTEPWWHDTRIFKCRDCETVQRSTLHLQE
ncbi:hypothetical protein [Desulfuromonas sp. AOP6]|uniref:hypothetical protein n=1 Tax=Desulfuromonas sp. AOP6 TaxID=1566351 RepID=UPI00128313E8|nr:hypothetical protein [Desulfuromonas sp. AOP6]BCA80584.1 hypothetical protein AOP6_2371 [Desulfuromonas sp. AOP6]